MPNVAAEVAGHASHLSTIPSKTLANNSVLLARATACTAVAAPFYLAH